MMGLAPYGKPTYVDKLRQLIHPVDDGRFELNLEYFIHHTEGVEMSWDDGAPQMGLVFSPKLADLLGPARDPEDPEFFGKVGRHRPQRPGGLRGDLLPRPRGPAAPHRPRQAGAGRRAAPLNSVANGKIFERTKFRELFRQPRCPADDGTAIGAAFYVEHAILGRPRGWLCREELLRGTPTPVSASATRR